MSIRKRTLIIIVFSMLLFLGGMSVLSGHLVMDSFIELEKDSLSRNTARAGNMLLREAEGLLRVNRDWSFWDDTYAYMDDLNEDFERINLQPETLETLHLSAIVFLSPEGTVRSAGPSPSEGGAVFTEWIRSNGAIVSPMAGDEGFSGFFLLEGRLFMVSGAPILKSDGAGPPKGVLVFAREVGAEEEESFSRSVLLPLKIHRAVPSLPAEPGEILASMDSTGAPFLSRPLSHDVISGFSLLRDLRGTPAAAAASLEALRREGISVALDDFGTGYSSLQYLNSLPIDRLKIDGSFIRRLFTGDGDRRLVKGILALAADLGMETVAEWIEREEEYLWILEQGATWGQGYFFGRPRPFEEAAALLLKTPPVI